MRREKVELDSGRGWLSGVLTRGLAPTAPLVVALHGASYDARYFDASGRSVHERAHAEGLSMLSITRPGYPATDESATCQPDFATAAVLLSSAIADAWSRFGVDGSGVVLMGHSVGAAIAVHIASQPSEWPLLGLAISGVGDRPAGGPATMFAGMPVDRGLEIPFAQVGSMFYSSDILIDQSVTARLASLLVPFPSADVVEVNTTWRDDLPRLAAAVTVPVDYTLAEGDRLWEVGIERLRDFGECFVASSGFTSRIWRGVGHNIEHHAAGVGYVDQVLKFVKSCGG